MYIYLVVVEGGQHRLHYLHVERRAHPRPPSGINDPPSGIFDPPSGICAHHSPHSGICELPSGILDSLGRERGEAHGGGQLGQRLASKNR